MLFASCPKTRCVLVPLSYWQLMTLDSFQSIFFPWSYDELSRQCSKWTKMKDHGSRGNLGITNNSVSGAQAVVTMEETKKSLSNIHKIVSMGASLSYTDTTLVGPHWICRRKPAVGWWSMQQLLVHTSFVKTLTAPTALTTGIVSLIRLDILAPWLSLNIKTKYFELQTDKLRV